MSNAKGPRMCVESYIMVSICIRRAFLHVERTNQIYNVFGTHFVNSRFYLYIMCNLNDYISKA